MSPFLSVARTERSSPLPMQNPVREWSESNKKIDKELTNLIGIIGIKHDFPLINIRKVPREVLKTEGEARGFQHFPRDLANVNE